MYISIDLDDTLLNGKKQITAYTKTILNECRKKGHKIIINTARNRWMCEEIMNEITFDYFVFNAGAQIIDNQKNTIIEYLIEKETLSKITPKLLALSEILSFQDEFVLYSNEINPRRKDIIYFSFDTPYQNKCYKILVKTQQQTKLKQISNDHNLDYTNYLNGSFSRLNHPEATKWKAIVNIMKYEQNNDEIISFGDDYGDIEMLEKSTVGVAMANSIQEVKNRINIHACSNNEDGVAKYLSKYFKIEREVL